MDPINVTAKFTDKGNIILLRLDMPGQILKVESTGREWEEEDGRHMLAMVEGNRVYHLLFSPQKMMWFIVPRPDIPPSTGA